MVMGPDGTRNEEWMCWRRPAAYHCLVALCRVRSCCGLISSYFENMQAGGQSLPQRGNLEREHLLIHLYEADHRKNSDSLSSGLQSSLGCVSNARTAPNILSCIPVW